MDEEPVTVLPRLRAVATPEAAHDRTTWRRPTANDLEFRMVRVTKDERTCLGCGETFGKGICPRCGLPEPGEKEGRSRLNRLPPSVPTESYLRPEEYRLVGV